MKFDICCHVRLPAGSISQLTLFILVNGSIAFVDVSRTSNCPNNSMNRRTVCRNLPWSFVGMLNEMTRFTPLLSYREISSKGGGVFCRGYLLYGMFTT